MCVQNTIVVVSKEDKFACSDANVESWMDHIIAEKLYVINIATETQFNMVRLMHVDKVINIENVYFNDDVIKIDINGQLERYPKGLFDKNENIIAKLIKWI